jgi:hypothetical protein
VVQEVAEDALGDMRGLLFGLVARLAELDCRAQGARDR